MPWAGVTGEIATSVVPGLAVPFSGVVGWVGLGAGAALVLAGAWRLATMRNPLVRQVLRDPSMLRRFPLGRTELVHQALLRAGRLPTALAAAQVSPEQWARLRLAGRGPEGAALALAQALGGELGGAIGAADTWTVELPLLALRFARSTRVSVVTGAQVDTSLLAGNPSGGGELAPVVELAIDLSETQTAREVLQALPMRSFVVVGRDALRDLLLAESPVAVFQQLVVQQRPLSELSPYVSSGGVDDAQLFFGRERELRQMADRHLHNFIVVAPRQMGKSTLLKALYRRLSARNDVEVYAMSLFEDDLPSRMGAALQVTAPEGTDQFMTLAAGTRRKPRVWLIDEADAFIVQDAQARYPLAQAMRTLSEEGRAYFVLAGFWHLYAAAFLNPNNPLRNFGELIRLEPLERSAARQLATMPMTALGLSYTSERLVELLLEQTACVAHLLVVACKAIVDGVDPATHRIDQELVERALYRNPSLSDEFKVWRRDLWGRTLLRAAMTGGAVTRAGLRERLSSLGLEPPTELFTAALDRLELGHLLLPDASGQLRCPIPLLQRHIEQEEELEAGLGRDVAECLSQLAAR